ncbi:MAG: stage V sporulation protein AC [Alicyclobacillaceae bacterium]|jgi:stage V sporulation protein AC|uniref:stage V sporulation protein AC n=1 Tax=Alicyclobacillus sp. SP_1 TaxID=2942475 RepID=UPI0021585BEC|nr:stage V sporulation protein AC [Alicyclobacillus sp. SP_1]MCY0888156.1 stage V sporulation protein AC [Alicyclobacillaceae bacterium]MCY0896500.1 stage V sporulation protein AC [Alicyclobacillaceae bacterium]
MAQANAKKLTPIQREYQALAKAYEPSRPLLQNFIRAFVVGGAISVLGQGLEDMFIHYFGFTQKTAGNPTVAILILLAALATGLGVFDKLASFAGAGTAVPVTGFANSIVSTALEHKSEGYVLGVGGNMFKLAGSVLVFGVVAAFFIGIIRSLPGLGG